MRTGGAGRLATALFSLALAGAVAGCGLSAGPKPNANAPTQNMKTGGPGTPNKSGVYNAGKRVAKKTGNSAGNAARFATGNGSNGTHGGKSAGKVYRNLTGSARKTARKTGASAHKAKNAANRAGASASKSIQGTGKRAGKAGGSRMRAGMKGAGMAGSARRGRSWILAGSALKPMSLATLPPLTYVQKLNPWLKHAHQVSAFITDMGYHWATPYPGIVLMTNQAGAVTAVEASFPQKLGQYSWWDPPTTQPNGGVAYNSEHLYFVAPASITPTMTASSSDLTSWSTFQAVNTRLSSYVKEPTSFFGFTVYGPPAGPGIKVLVGSTGTVSGFLVEEPAVNGHFPGYYPGRRKALPSKEFGKAYDSVLLLTPVRGGTKP